MHLDPDTLAAKPTSRVLRWAAFWREQAMADDYRAKEAAWRAQRDLRMH